MTSWLLDKFKCCCKYCSTLCFSKGNYARWSKQKCDGPSRWSISSGIRPNTLNLLLQLGSNIWMSWTVRYHAKPPLTHCCFLRQNMATYGLLSRTLAPTVSSKLLGFCFSFHYFFVSLPCARFSSEPRDWLRRTEYVMCLLGRKTLINQC